MVESTPLQQLADILQHTLSAQKDERKRAEDYLQSVESTPNYGLLLLQLLTMESVQPVIRTAASVTFKNFIKRNWRIVEGETNKVSEDDRNLIKTNIVELMLKSPESIQKQLSDAISIIGREDFPEKWKDLIDTLASHMQITENLNLHTVNGVLQTAHSLFKRFRYEFKSQNLWLELAFVLKKFAEPLLTLFKHMISLVPANMTNVGQLKPIFEVLIMICKLFYCLNYQDLPEFFEDHMAEWMEPFHMLVVTDFKVLETDDADEVGPLEKLRSQICDNVTLYAQKYDSEFGQFLPKFVEAIWNLLVTTGLEVKHDLLVSNAIQFLASVCERPHYKDLFAEQGTLQGICEKVIVPNMMFRDADEEVFEDNAEEYIRKDMEGSDNDTRRRAASDLVRGLCKYYEKAVTDIFSQYVNSMLGQYAANPAANWKSKDAAVYIVTSLAAKKSTAKHGTTEASELVNLVDFFNSQIAQDLNSGVDEFPVLKADAIKYVITFRSVLPRDILLSCFQPLVSLLRAKSNVVHSYAACAIDKLALVKSPGGGAPFGVQELLPLRDSLFTNLFDALTLPGSSENDYIMKAVMRACALMKEGILPIVNNIVTKLAEILATVSKNPSKPQFNHYLFESICTLIRTVGQADKTKIATIEETIFPVIQVILTNFVTEFLPYVFQVLSLAVEMREAGVSGPYMDLFPTLLQPVLWEQQGNVPALTKLLQAFVKRGAAEVVATDKLMPLLGVFQKLIASRANDHEGFYLLSSMVEHIPWPSLQACMKQVFTLLFQRLQTSKTTKYVKGFIVFVSLFAGLKSGELCREYVDSVQPKLFAMMAEKILVADLQKVSGKTERKICAVGVTKMLTEVPSFLEVPEYVSQWAPLLQALIGLFELPEDDSVPDDEHFIDVEDTPGYQNVFSQLAYGTKKDNDPFHEILDPKEYLAKQLYRLSLAHPGKLRPALSAGLQPDASGFLQQYLNKAQVQIS